MGNKGSTTTQTVKIPPEVMARYNAVNKRAEALASRPFQPYTGQFVAGLTGQQQAGMAGINAATGMAQPYYETAAAMTQAGAGPVGRLTREQIREYENPYTESVVDPTRRALEQQQGQERAMLAAQAIRSGAFGGDRAGLERANLARQQSLGMAQAISPLYQQGYQQAVQTAMGQQGIRAADLQRQLAAGQQYAGLGTAAQQAALQAAQAQIGAGTLEQQTQQADLTAKYQQFLQERGYDFQVAQFLANIAMGTGALSGSTTTTTQPSSFFSDERMKENIQPIGETFDGQKIYKYNYKGEPGTQIGLIAQEVERKHPEAVGMAGGMKTVDYDRATEHAGGLGKAMSSMGGAVHEPGAYSRGGYAPGGLVDPNDLQAILASQRESFGPYMQGGPYGQSAQQAPFSGAGGIVPAARLPTPKLVTAGPVPRQQESGMQEAMRTFDAASDAGSKIGKTYDFFAGTDPKKDSAGNPIQCTGTPSLKERVEKAREGMRRFLPGSAHGGGVRPHYAAGGGSINPYDPNKNPMDYFPEEVLEDNEQKNEMLKPGQAPGQGQSGLGQLANAVGTASTIATGIGKVAPYLMALIPSDERLKHDIEPVGKTYDGQNIYRYHMGDGAMRMGLMAQEVAERNPDAVARGPGGYLMLDYDKATGDAVPHEGGVRPREGLREGGTPDRSGIIDIIRREAEAQGVPFDVAYNIARRESGLNPAARAETSTAGGLYQIIDPTFKALGVEGDKMDPNVNARAGIKYIGQNIAALREAGQETSPGNVYLAHFLGTEGARRVLSNPDAPLAETIPNFERVVAANPFVGKMATGRDIANWADTRMGSDAYRPAPQAKAEGVKPSSSFFGTPPTSFQTGKPFESYGDFFKSKQFVVPFLTGIGAMAQSPSRYLGAAVLQGLGAGAQSYANLEQQQAGIAKTKAETELTGTQEQQILADIPRTAMIVDELGRTVGVRVYVNGRMTTVTPKQYFDALRSGRPYDLAPVGGSATAGGLGAGATGTGGPSAPGGVGPAATAPAEPARSEPAAAPGGVTPPVYRVLPEDIRQLAETRGIQVQETGVKNLEKSPEANPFDAQSEAARLSSQNLGQRNMLAKNLAEIGRKGKPGPIEPGKFSAEVGTPVASWLKGFLRNAGVDAEGLNSLQDLGKTEVVEKIRRQLSLGLASGAGQRAAQVFEELMAAVPGQVNDPEAAAQLVSDIYFISQREVDLDRFYRQVRSEAERRTGINQSESRFIGQGLYDAYMSRMQGQYATEKEAIRRMYLDKIEVKDPATGKQIQTYVLPYLLSNPQGIPRNIQAEIAKRYGPDILRYFNGQ